MSFQFSTQDELNEQMGLLLEEDPEKVRLVLKYHNGKKEFTARATDDDVCLKFRTGEKSGIRGTGRLLESAMAQMCGVSAEELAAQREQTQGSSKKKRKKATKS